MSILSYGQKKSNLTIVDLTTIVITSILTFMKPCIKQYVGYWINKVRMCMHLSFEKRLAKYDLTVAKWCVMISLYGDHAASVGELATYIEIDKASISRVVLSLINLGLISQKKGKDRRSGHLQLTKEGLNLIPLILEEAKQNEDFYFEDLSKHEINQLQSTLHKILAKSPSPDFEGWLKSEKNNP